MAQVSKYPVSKEVSDRMFEVLQDTISSLNGKADVEEFLGELLSPIEKIMLAKRLAIAILLTKRYSYPSIIKILRVTPGTIATVSLTLKYKGKGYQKAVEKILLNEKMSDFWQKIEDLLGGLPATKGSFIYARDKYDREKRKRKTKAF
jgi:uncharacterized protein YerC